MLHHIVMWKLKDFAEGNSKKENALLMKYKFEELMPLIKEIKKLDVGINMESSQYSNFDIVPDTWFENYGQMEIYQKHPMHIEISDWIGKIRETRAAVDYEI
jgi:Stress responsive A/B Barrel Domain